MQDSWLGISERATLLVPACAFQEHTVDVHPFSRAAFEALLIVRENFKFVHALIELPILVRMRAADILRGGGETHYVARFSYPVNGCL